MTRMDKKKQIEELARIISSHCRDLPTCEGCKFEGTSTDEIECFDLFSASRIYNAGYRKQSEGEWEIVKGSNGKEKMVCTNCRHQQDLASTFTYCPNCSARTKGVEK